MKVIGFLNRFGFFPVPVVLVVVVEEKHYFIFPTGVVWEMDKEEGQHELQRTHEYHGLPEPVLIIENQVGYAFSKAELKVGTRGEIQEAVKARLQGDDILPEHTRFWLRQFLIEEMIS